MARFDGDSNTWVGRLGPIRDDQTEITTGDGLTLKVRAPEGLAPGTEVTFFLRPEAILIEPDAGLEGLNRMPVVVKSILFDGANSRLLASPLTGERELLIALPQNRQYDYIAENDRITIGWDAAAGVCFPLETD